VVICVLLELAVRFRDGELASTNSMDWSSAGVYRGKEGHPCTDEVVGWFHNDSQMSVGSPAAGRVDGSSILIQLLAEDLNADLVRLHIHLGENGNREGEHEGASSGAHVERVRQLWRYGQKVSNDGTATLAVSIQDGQATMLVDYQ
jgi:hypothetical protein